MIIIILIFKERGGILADAGMCVQSNIFAAGDVCSFEDITLGRRRLEQWEHAQISGRLAGENMTGGTKKYTHQSSFYTMLGSNVHFSGVGDVNAKYETASIFAEPHKVSCRHRSSGVAKRGAGEGDRFSRSGQKLIKKTWVPPCGYDTIRKFSRFTPYFRLIFSGHDPIHPI